MPAGLEPLLESLGRAQRKGFEYKGFVANHAPMGAEVLSTMDVGEELVGWTDTYLTWVDDPEPAKQRIDGDPVSLACALGDIERSTDWIEFFTRELAEAHWRDVVDAWWPRLLRGISAAGDPRVPAHRPRGPRDERARQRTPVAARRDRARPRLLGGALPGAAGCLRAGPAAAHGPGRARNDPVAPRDGQVPA